ncbi:MAG TPA: hypothetical protein VFD23_04780 [Clostridia bacterium]|nr:hypothetical protein [Clostridia bacterium]
MRTEQAISERLKDLKSIQEAIGVGLDSYIDAKVETLEWVLGGEKDVQRM